MTSQRARTLTRPASQDEQDVAENWEARGACTRYNPEIWYSDDKRKAVHICKTECPVREICLKNALETNDRFGVRGGLSARQRRSIAKGGSTGTAAANAAVAKRHADVMKRIATLALAGKYGAEIAAEIGLAPGTVTNHLQTLRKTGVIPEDAGRKPRKLSPINHGSRAGVDAHRRRNEPPCDECLTGYNDAQRLRRLEIAARVRS